jgi:hypothetical protein
MGRRQAAEGTDAEAGYVVFDTVLDRVIAGDPEPLDKATADAVAKSAAHKATVRKA